MSIDAINNTVPQQEFGAKLTPKQELREATKAFEAIFLEQMIREGRESGLGPSLLSSDEGDTFHQMLDAEQAKAASRNLSLGIADALYKQLSPVLGE